MYKIIYKISFSFLLILAMSLFSFQEGEFRPMSDVEDFKTGIKTMSASTNSIHASFGQKKHLSILTHEIESEGILKFKKPNLLRWEYKTPYNYTVILNGKKLLISDDGKVNSFDLTSSKTFQQINELIIKSVQGDVLDEERFNITYFESKDLFLAKLQPKEKQLGEFLKEIHVYFDRSDFSVNKIKLLEPAGDYTLIAFTNKKLNETIPDAAFTLE